MTKSMFERSKRHNIVHRNWFWFEVWEPRRPYATVPKRVGVRWTFWGALRLAKKHKKEAHMKGLVL